MQILSSARPVDFPLSIDFVYAYIRAKQQQQRQRSLHEMKHPPKTPNGSRNGGGHCLSFPDSGFSLEYIEFKQNRCEGSVRHRFPNHTVRVNPWFTLT